jgi:hypothetical protein
MDSLGDSTREWNLATTKKLDAMARDMQVALKGDSTPNNMFGLLATELKSYSDQAWNRSRIETILKGLRFEHIRERESRVETAHRATFQWVFDQNSPVNLGAWLRTGNGTYWIEGKAGSGKSTMMKYLLQHEETSRSLQQWASDKELFIGSHFFWTMGTNLQKSQIGLLRTMLFQLLKSHPDLVPVACPDRLSIKNFEHLESWTMEALVRSFRLLLSYQPLAIRMCFFIDGLDEYSGIHTDLVGLLDSFAKSDCIKICVSSRPWPEFREAYGAIPYRLCIHEFTRPDIHAFAHGRLTENPRFEALRRENSGEEADRLVDEITARAEGVFLWVYYVVRSLLRGLSNRDDIYVLRTRLLQFPQELTDFFKHMFHAIDSVYKPQAAMLLKMLAASEQPLPIFPLVLADLESRFTNGRGDPGTFSKHLPLAYALPFDVSRFEQEREAITGRCRDLIHAVDVGEPGSPVRLWDIRIGFLHRTVSDFISTSEMELVLAHFLEPDFHPEVYLLHALALAAERAVTEHLGSLPAPIRGEGKIWQCVRASLLDFLRLAIHIHNDGDVNTMRKATIVFGELSPLWDDIFVPTKVSSYSPHKVPDDNNAWIALDRKSLLRRNSPMGVQSLFQVDGLFHQEFIFRPENIWQLLGALGLTGYITACSVSTASVLRSVTAGGPNSGHAREATLGAFCRGAVLDDSGFMQLQYTERWNIKALRVLLSWWALSTSLDAPVVDMLWENYMARMLSGFYEEPGTPPWEESLEMAKLLLANGAKKSVMLPAWLLTENTTDRVWLDRPPAWSKALEELLPSDRKRKPGSMWSVPSYRVLMVIFGEKEGQELERMFCGARDTAGSRIVVARDKGGASEAS